MYLEPDLYTPKRRIYFLAGKRIRSRGIFRPLFRVLFVRKSTANCIHPWLSVSWFIYGSVRAFSKIRFQLFADR